MSLLLNERPLVILPQLAATIGLNEAIVLQQIHWLCSETQFGKEHDGHRWIYNTPEGWQKAFPFMSASTIRRTLDNLRDMGLVKAEQLEGIMRPMFYRIADSTPVLLKEGKLPTIQGGEDVNTSLGKNDKPHAQIEHTGTLKLSKPYIDKENNKDSPLPPQGADGELILQVPTQPPPQRLTPNMERIGKLYNRRKSTRWSKEELKALRAIEPIDEDDFRTVERHYAFLSKQTPDYRKRDVLTLLRQWNSAVDQARKFKEPACY